MCPRGQGLLPEHPEKTCHRALHYQRCTALLHEELLPVLQGNADVLRLPGLLGMPRLGLLALLGLELRRLL
jgi:hypothetical protein